MKREIKFRAKSVRDNEWHYGFYYEDGAFAYILDLDENEFVKHEHVDDDTIGQYTGLKDKNGKEIYEGDIFQYMTCNPHAILFKYAMFGYISSLGEFIGLGANANFTFQPNETDLNICVVGNIYDNPELLEEE